MMNTKININLSAEKRFYILITLQISMLALISYFIFSPDRKIHVNDNHEYLRETGNQLQAVGLSGESLRLYEQYLNQTSLTASEKASLLFRMGELAEQNESFEKALAFYYQIELVDSESRILPESKKKIIALLEKLGKFSAVKYALNESTSLEKNKGKDEQGKSGGIVIAQIGSKNIYLHQVNEMLDHLPAELRQTFSGKEGKIKFAQKYIADELLYQKAQRQGLDKDTQYRSQLEMVEKNLLIQKLLEKDILQKIKIDETSSDLKNYFMAHQERYQTQDKKGKKLRFEQVKENVLQDYRLQKQQELYQQIVDETLKTEKVQFFMEKVQ